MRPNDWTEYNAVSHRIGGFLWKRYPTLCDADREIVKDEALELYLKNFLDGKDFPMNYYRSFSAKRAVMRIKRKEFGLSDESDDDEEENDGRRKTYRGRQQATQDIACEASMLLEKVGLLPNRLSAVMRDYLVSESILDTAKSLNKPPDVILSEIREARRLLVGGYV